MSIIDIIVLMVVIAIVFCLTGQITEPYQKWVRIILAILFIIFILNWWGGFGNINLNSKVR